MGEGSRRGVLLANGSAFYCQPSMYGQAQRHSLWNVEKTGVCGATQAEWIPTLSHPPWFAQFVSLSPQIHCPSFSSNASWLGATLALSLAGSSGSKHPELPLRTTSKRGLHPRSHKTIYYLSTLAPARTNPPRQAPAPRSRRPTAGRRGTGRRPPQEAFAEAQPRAWPARRRAARVPRPAE